MWAWDEPASVATGILDDETYDWAQLVKVHISYRQHISYGNISVMASSTMRHATGPSSSRSIRAIDRACVRVRVCMHACMLARVHASVRAWPPASPTLGHTTGHSLSTSARAARKQRANTSFFCFRGWARQAAASSSWPTTSSSRSPPSEPPRLSFFCVFFFFGGGVGYRPAANRL